MIKLIDLLYRRYADPVGAMAAAGQIYPFVLYLIGQDTAEKARQDERRDWELFLHSNAGSLSYREWRDMLTNG